VRAAAEIGPDADPILAAGLTDRSPRVREKTAIALIDYGIRGQITENALARALDDDVHGVRKAALNALQVLADDPLPKLRKNLKHADEHVRVKAAGLL